MTVNYGHFDPQTSEYVITDPMTPEPWINYLDGNGKMNAFISNGAGGTVWYDQPHTGRLTRYRLNGLPMDSPGFYLYIKDGADIWNPSFFPTMALSLCSVQYLRPINIITSIIKIIKS